MADDRSAAAGDRETPGAAAESTRIIGPTGGANGAGGVGQPPAGPDATTAMPAADATARIADPSARIADATARIQGMTDPGQQPTQRVTPRIWAARVPIPPDDIAPVREGAPPEWEQPQGEPQPDETGGRPPLHPALIT